MPRYNPWYDHARHTTARNADKAAWYCACYGGALGSATIDDLVACFDMGGEL